MMIHPDQTNVRQLCEVADFIDSGYQSFHEQVRSMSRKKEPEAAFFAGAALAMKLMEHFRQAEYKEHEVECLKGLICLEINAYMERNGLQLEWEPHVPSSWQQ
jgi:hypothetical protein